MVLFGPEWSSCDLSHVTRGQKRCTKLARYSASPHWSQTSCKATIMMSDAGDTVQRLTSSRLQTVS